MTPKDSTYETVMPKQPEGTTVEFYISATDSEGNTRESDNFAYTVGKELGILWTIIELIVENPWIIIGLVVGIALLVFLVKR